MLPGEGISLQSQENQLFSSIGYLYVQHLPALTESQP